MRVWLCAVAPIENRQSILGFSDKPFSSPVSLCRGVAVDYWEAAGEGQEMTMKMRKLCSVTAPPTMMKNMTACRWNLTSLIWCLNNRSAVAESNIVDPLKRMKSMGSTERKKDTIGLDSFAYGV